MPPLERCRDQRLAIALTFAGVQSADASVKINLSKSQKDDLAQTKIILHKAVVEHHGGTYLDYGKAIKYAKDRDVEKFARGWRAAGMGIFDIPTKTDARLRASLVQQPAECHGKFRGEMFDWGTRTMLTSCQTKKITEYGTDFLFAAGFVAGIFVFGDVSMDQLHEKVIAATMSAVITLNVKFLSDCNANDDGTVIYNIWATSIAWCKSQHR